MSCVPDTSGLNTYGVVSLSVFVLQTTGDNGASSRTTSVQRIMEEERGWGLLVAMMWSPHRGRPVSMLECSQMTFSTVLSRRPSRSLKLVVVASGKELVVVIGSKTIPRLKRIASQSRHRSLIVNSHTLYRNSTATMLSIDSSTADVSWGLDRGQATRDAPDTDLYRW
jgi:hypothetical protein